jgi:hypothetical protein
MKLLRIDTQDIGVFTVIPEALFLSNPPKNTPSIAVGLDGDEFGIVGASPTINKLAHP